MVEMFFWINLADKNRLIRYCVAEPPRPITVAIVPLDSRVPVQVFTERLQQALGFLGDVAHLSLLASSEHSSRLTTIDKQLTSMEHFWCIKPKDLVLLHFKDCKQPSGTLNWLKVRDVESHHHLQWGKDADVSRIARFHTNRAIGVVLGGGGAKGIAHIGGLYALQETGIPIDDIGGTSIGSGVALQFAKNDQVKQAIEVTRTFMTTSKAFGNRTVPIHSLYDGVQLDNWPSPRKVGAGWLNPLAEPIPQVPSVVEWMVQSMLTHSISRRKRDVEVADLYLRPPVEDFSIFDFHKFDDILHCGKQYTARQLQNWHFDPTPQELKPTKAS